MSICCIHVSYIVFAARVTTSVHFSSLLPLSISISSHSAVSARRVSVTASQSKFIPRKRQRWIERRGGRMRLHARYTHVCAVREKEARTLWTRTGCARGTFRRRDFPRHNEKCAEGVERQGGPLTQWRNAKRRTRQAAKCIIPWRRPGKTCEWNRGATTTAAAVRRGEEGSVVVFHRPRVRLFSLSLFFPLLSRLSPRSADTSGVNDSAAGPFMKFIEVIVRLRRRQ